MSTKTIIEESSHFVFTGKYIATYNDRICVLYPLKTEFVCSVPADEFLKIMAKIMSDDVDISLHEDKLKIKAGKVKASLSVKSGEFLIKMIESLQLDSVKFRNLPKDFIDGIQMCIFSAAKDLSNPVLSCLSIDTKHILSSDDLRISHYEMSEKMRHSFLLPAFAAIELIQFPVVKYSLINDEAWAIFSTEDDILFGCRLLTGNYPDYMSFLGGDKEGEIKLPDDIQRMIETADILSDDGILQDRKVDIVVEGDNISIKGQNSVGWIESNSHISPAVKNKITLAINPLFLLNVLKYSKSIFVSDGKASFLFDKFEHIIALKEE